MRAVKRSVGGSSRGPGRLRRELWNAAFLSELVWIVGANIVYALVGGLILRTGVVADWAGWVALFGGTLIASGVAFRRDGFPQLGILVPALIGTAVLIETL